MARDLFYRGYMVQLILLLCAVIAAAVINTPAIKRSELLSAPELTNASVYPEIIDKSFAGIKADAAIKSAAGSKVPLMQAEPALLPPAEGPGGPILVVSTRHNPFSRYTVEILRAEGLNEFAALDISEITATILLKYDVVILGEMEINARDVSIITAWVNGGGTLIAFRPCELLTPLLGISPARGTLYDQYLLVKTTTGPGVGIVNQTIQFHGPANLHVLKEATSLATLFSSAYTSTGYPAVTSVNAGSNGGRAIAFTYDLPRSIVYTRQGNPEWAGQKRDGHIDPIRPDDLFYPDWIDFSKIAIPQADEQQRLLANIILQTALHRKPLPRFWYLPGDLKAAIIMTGDDHSNTGTIGRFYQYLQLGPNSPQDVADWKAIRATSYIYSDMPITNQQAVFFQEQGFEISLHTNTGCFDYTHGSLHNDITNQLQIFARHYPGVSVPVTNRNHCLAWSDWASTPKVEFKNGIRLDANYYYWPEAWMQNRPGMFTGSGIPMRFADLDGSIIDVYQVATQMTDETNMNYSEFCNALLDKAIGPEGYYGVFCANMHTDDNFSAGSNEIIASAQARGIPIISARQMLTWLDGRTNSSFSNIIWKNNQLSFNILARKGAYNLRSMLPLYAETGELISITMNGKHVTFTTQTIKGMEYAFFPAAAGNNNYIANYNRVLPGKGIPMANAGKPYMENRIDK